MKNQIRIFIILLFVLLIQIDRIHACGVIVSKGYPTRGCAPLVTQLQVISDSADSIVAINWNFRNDSYNYFGYSLKDTIIKHTFLKYSTYYPTVTIKYKNGTKCIATYDSIVVYGKPHADAHLISNATQCIHGNSFCFADTLDTISNSKSPVHYYWDFGNGLKDSDISSLCYTYPKTGAYRVLFKVVDANGCLDSTKFKINVLSDSSLAIALVYNKGCVFYLNSDTVGWNITRVKWDFGDSTAMDSSGWIVNHKYHHNGKYPVTMYVSVKNGCDMSITTWFYVYVTGVDLENTNELSCKIYPNPSQGNFSIDYSLSENAHIDMFLYDMTGRKISELINQNQSSGNHTLHSDNFLLPDGTYILKIFKDNLPAGQRLIIVHQ